MREPRRQARRLRARDPDAGQRPDRDPAARRQGSRRGGGDHRQDGAARALRPRDEPRRPVDRRADEAADRDTEALRPARGPAGARQRARRSRTTSSARRGSSWCEARCRRAGRRSQSAGGEAAERATSCSRCRRRRSSCTAAPSDVVCPGVGESPPTRNYWYLLKLRRRPTVPEMTGDGPEALRHPAGLRHADRRADRAHGVHRQGRRTRSQEITRDDAIRGKLLFNTVGGGQGDYRNFLQHFAIVLDREIKSWPSIDFDRSTRAASRARTARRSPALASIERGEGPRARAPDRRAAGRVRHARPDRDLGDARQGLAQRGEEGGDRRPARSSRSSCSIFYRFLGVVAVLGLGVYAAFLYAAILLFNVTLTLPGFAGLVLTLGVAADANVVIFERIKEEARAGRSVRAAIQTGLHEGLRDDRRRERRHRDHRARAVRGRDRERARLRADAARSVPRSRCSPPCSRRARSSSVLAGFEAARQPARDGRRRRRHPALAEARLHRQAATLVRDLRRRGRRSRSSRSRVKGLNLGIDFKGGTQIAFETPRADVRSSRCASRRRRSARRTRSSRAAARSTDGDVPELPDPDRVAHDRRGPGSSSRT